MTREEKQKVIDALKISAPVMAVFKDYIQLLNKIVDWLEQEPTTKNDLGVDCIARQDVERYIEGFINEYTPEEELEFINLELDGLKHLPPVTPQEPTGKNFTKADIDTAVKAINEVWELRVNEILGMIRAEIETKYGQCKLTEYIVQYDGVCTGANDIGDIADILRIIDKFNNLI